MIAKSVKRSKKSKAYGALAKYISNSDKQSGIANDWGNLASYTLDKTNGGKKVSQGSIRYSNFDGIINSLEEAILEVEETQKYCASKSNDKTYHLVISFPPNEKPTKEQLIDIEDELVKSIGFEDHERVSAIHTDQEHLHIHVAINKVNPNTYKLYSPSFDKKKLMEACKLLEKKHKLQQTHIGKNKLIDGTIINQKIESIEERTGEKSLLTWVKENAKDSLILATTWKDLQERANKYGLVFKKKGAGLIFAVKDNEKLFIKGSDIDRSLSLQQLEKKFGLFEELKEINNDGQKEYKLEPKYFEKTPEAELLWKSYVLEKHNRQEQRKRALEEIKERHKLIREKARAYVRDQKKHARVRLYTHARLKMFKLQADQIIQKSIEEAALERDKVFQQYKLINWNDYLAEQAKNGDQYALKLLRKAQRRNQELNDNLFRMDNWEEGKHFINDKVRSYVSYNGNVSYSTKDGGKVVDKINCVVVSNTTNISIALALELANKKFDRPLTINGTKEFKETVAKIAAINGNNIVFANSEMEELKNIAILERKKIQERIAKGNTYLAVPIKDIEIVKKAGAEWDSEKKLWYLKAGLDAKELGLEQYLDGKGNYSIKSHYLIVPMEDRIKVKELGARWDKTINRWYVPSGYNLNDFKKWLKGNTTLDKMNMDKEELIVPNQFFDFVKRAGAEWDKQKKKWYVPLGVTAKDIGLESFSEKLGRFSKERLYLYVPFKDKDKVKELGARWDAIKKLWFVPPKTDLSLFEKWINNKNLKRSMD